VLACDATATSISMYSQTSSAIHQSIFEQRKALKSQLERRLIKE
jgi:hypothetical protein